MPHRALSVLENLPDQSILQRIGNTPLIRIRLLEKELPQITFYAKAEWFNPGGSVKDRPALRMIEEAERTGELTVERVILDSTSGNTGIAYALIGAAKGYQVKLVMPANVNEERREIVKAFGAEAIFTPALEGSDGAIREAHRIKESAPGVYYMPDQYNNPFNWRAHFDTTGPEILDQAHDLARSEGLLVGNSSGAALYAAREVARRTSEGVFVMVFPDGGDRYLSSGLYRRKF